MIIISRVVSILEFIWIAIEFIVDLFVRRLCSQILNRDLSPDLIVGLY